MKLFQAPHRNAITWSDDESLMFEYYINNMPAAATTACGDGVYSASPKSAESSFSDDSDEIAYENQTVDSCGCRTGASAAANVELLPLIFCESLDALHLTEHDEVGCVVILGRACTSTDVVPVVGS